MTNTTSTTAPAYWAVYRRPGDTADQATAWASQDRRDAFLARHAVTVTAVGVR